jgi:hypothetical protein
MWISPLSGTIDAAIPHAPDDATALLGIDRIRVVAPNGCQPDCWSLCVPGTEQGNTIERVRCSSDNAATLELRRPLTPGFITLLRYGDGATPDAVGRFAALPGDVNGDGVATPGDVLDLVDVLNGVAPPRWGLFSTDIDRSGQAQATDILSLVDLLNGAGQFEVYNGRSLPPAPADCP